MKIFTTLKDDTNLTFSPGYGGSRKARAARHFSGFQTSLASVVMYHHCVASVVMYHCHFDLQTSSLLSRDRVKESIIHNFSAQLKIFTETVLLIFVFCQPNLLNLFVKICSAIIQKVKRFSHKGRQGQS